MNRKCPQKIENMSREQILKKYKKLIDRKDGL